MFRTATANTTNTRSNNSLLFQNGKGEDSFIQPKLNIGKPGDKYEVEADHVADTIVSKRKEQTSPFFDTSSTVQKQKEEVQKSEDLENQIQEKPLVENITPLIQKQTEEEPIQEKEEQEEIQKQPEEEIQQQEKAEENQIQEKPVEETNTALVQPQVEEEPVQEKEEQEEIQQKPEEEVQQKVEEEVQQQEIIPEPSAPEAIETNTTAPDIQNVEEEIQEKEEEEEEEQIQEKRFVQKAEDPDGNSGSGTSSIESRLNSTSGGSSLPKDTQSQMESGFGTDFSNVRVHTDSSAVQMNKDLGAQAFTHGNDIYFNEGKYNTASTSGQHLLAHELTHTVQQGASVQRKMIQKSTAPALPSSPGTLKSGLVSNSNETITYHSLPVTAFKITGGRNHLYTQHSLKRNKKYTGSRVGVNQRAIWKKEVDAKNIEKILLEKHKKANGVDTSASGSHTVYAFRVKKSKTCYLTGTINNIVKEAVTPKWDNRGRCPKYFQVDHIVEMQISGFPDDTSVNAIDNLELLERGANVNSGKVIKAAVERKVRRTLKDKDANAALEQKIPGLAKTTNVQEKIKQVKNKYHLIFNGFTRGAGPRRVGTDKYWIRSQIEAGDHLKHIIPVNMSELGSADSLLIFPRRYHPVGMQFKWDGSNQTPTSREKNWFAPWVITSKTFTNNPNSDVLGQFVLDFPSNDPLIRATGGTVEIKKIPGAQFAGYVDNVVDGGSGGRKSIINAGNIVAKQFSPVRLDEVTFQDDSVLVKGKVLPTLGFIKKAELDFIIQNSEIEISKTFTNDTLSLPSPFVLRETSLTLFASSKKGLGLKGNVDFEIKQVGEGHISAAASTSGGIELKGAFNFDSKIFDPAEVKVEYKDNKWSVEGTIGIPEGKVPGVKKATIKASYKENNFAAEGEADLNVPGVDSSRLSVKYGEKGFSVEGDFKLNSDLPGIKSGSVHAKIAKKEGAESYDIFVSGKAKPDIPGVDSEIDITYNNGALLIQGKTKIKLESSNTEGEVTVGVTNQVIGKDNKPTGEISESWSIFGSGDVSFVLTKGIVANAKVVLQPNGDIIVSGGVKLDRSDKKPKEKRFDKNLFKIGPPDIILFALPIGVYLTLGIEGRADLYASFTPPYFKELQLSFNNFNLTKPEENTDIEGKIIIAMSGKGGFTLGLTLKATLSALIAKVEGSLTGNIGLEANAEAKAELGAKWSNKNGLEIKKGEISLEANAQFIAELIGKIRVYLDLWLAEIDIWEEKLEIAKVKFGDSLKIGFKLPISTENGELKAGEINKDSFEYPDISSDSKQQKLVEQGAKQDDKVKPPPPPSKEEAVRAVRKLDAGPVDYWKVATLDGDEARALVALNWIARDTYIMWLKIKHSKIDWSEAVAMGRRRDNADFESLKGEVQGMEQGFLRMGMIAKFKKDHFLFTKSNTNKINQLMTSQEELV
ncbi:eCIS core domain-containing protein [Aquimarina rubra]|uniref:DUF4157 domain-containing protein n=1 Tax=Aquimarina rubra TaxID=1920033 RepID=A0ABW5LPD4_9FLAO